MFQLAVLSPAELSTAKMMSLGELHAEHHNRNQKKMNIGSAVTQFVLSPSFSFHKKTVRDEAD